MGRSVSFTSASRRGCARVSLTAVALGNPQIVRKSLIALVAVGMACCGWFAWPHRAQAQNPAQNSSTSAAPTSDAAYAMLRDYAQAVADTNTQTAAPVSSLAADAHRAFDHAAFVRLHADAAQLAAEHPLPQFLVASTGQIPSAPDATAAALNDNAGPSTSAPAQPDAAMPADHGAFMRLHDYAQKLAGDRSAAAAPDEFRVADADNAFDALREFLQQHSGSAPPPAAAPVQKPPPATPRPEVAATYVGNKACLGCHAQEIEHFKFTMMGRLQTQGKMQCETCHGPGSEHVRLGGGRGVGGIISFRGDDRSRTVAENNAICLSCHERGERTMWDGSVHQLRDVACSDCHTVMRNVSAQHQLKTPFEPDTCYQCHKDKRAQVMFSSHMPVLEGKMVCSDCHNPHGSFTEAMLRTDSINDTCYKCHAEKRGPFLFEHEPVRENCLNCHNPHGSINQDMLRLSMPRLCYECHTIGHAQSGPNSQFTMGQACLNCHSQIHGSNSPSGFLFNR
jgi:DmsE family decaheme c-type cytochrome